MKKSSIFLLDFLLVGLLVNAQVSDSNMRHVPLQGATNFRDLGGYNTTDGHHVKWGKIYRSADISKLTPDDLSSLAKRNIDYVIDLRGHDESAKAPDRMNPHTDYTLCPAGSDQNLSDWMKSLQNLQSGGDSMMIVYYGKTEFFSDRYRALFEKLLSMPDSDALLLHCTAGKDRTGIGTALLLYSLGVSYDTIMADYLATNYYRQAENKRMAQVMAQYMHINEQVARDIMSARKEYLDEAFRAIKARYGSVDQFLRWQLGLDENKIAILKAKYLD
jgi:protein-tyrosine phosphatase